MTPGRASLETLLRGCGIALNADQYDQLWVYHGMLREANARLNLTRLHSFESMVLKHYADSLLVLQYAELPSPLVDMGSGAGLPGIPLKIARPEVRMILAEPRGARADFLREVVEKLGLEGIEVYAGKVGPRFPNRVEGIISRAVATIPDTLDRAASCLNPGGKMLFMKGPDCDDEIDGAAKLPARTFRLESDIAYSIPKTPHDRRLVVFERTDAPAPRYEEEPERPEVHAGPVREVSSDSNPTFKLCREILTGKGIRKQGQALMSGPRVVAEVIDRFPDRVAAWISEPEGDAPPAELGGSATWLKVAAPLFKELDVAGTHSPILLVQVPAIPLWSDDAPWPVGCTLFVPFQDPENVGAVIRSAAAFGVSRVVLLREAAHPFHPKASRASGPSALIVPLEQGPSIQELESRHVPILALSAEGDDIAAGPLPERFGLVVGIEGPGLPDRLRKGPLRRIPIAPGVESINAATAAAIALYEWRRSSPIGTINTNLPISPADQMAGSGDSAMPEGLGLD